jgi:xylose isomerase
MRTYLILKERAERWNADAEIQALVKEMNGSSGSGRPGSGLPARDALLGQTFDRAALAASGLAYERLDQLTMEVLLGAR